MQDKKPLRIPNTKKLKPLPVQFDNKALDDAKKEFLAKQQLK